MAETLTYVPYDTVSVTHTPDVNAIRFGDGYVQAQANGLNHNPQVWNITLLSQSDATIAQMNAFFEAESVTPYFLWTPPNDTERRFKCMSWEVSYDHYIHAETLKATLQEVFA